MKRIITGICLFFASAGFIFSQTAAEKEVAATVEKIRVAIEKADKAALEELAADQLVYAHSNGRVQDKADFIKEILDPAAIDYTSITMTDQTIRVIGNTAVVRHIYSAETMTGGKPGSLKIGNMFVLQKQKKNWKLIARQAYRLQ
jgi:ketosteroid isomerase-like protein